MAAGKIATVRTRAMWQRAALRAALGAALVLVLGNSLAEERAATALVPAAATRLPAAALAALCARLPSPCTPASTKALVAASAPAGRLYLLDDSRPWLAALDEREPSDAARARVWDFSAYRHSVPPAADGGAPPALHLHPALYPVGAAGQAVAIVSTTREMYSGGGAFFDVADFVALDGTPTTTPKVLYAAIPFACSKTIRACFSEREYRRSLHCTDDSTGHLTIGFGGVSGSAPGWSFRWHELSWPAHVGVAKQRWNRSSFVVPAGPRPADAGTAAQSASFCGGPA